MLSIKVKRKKTIDNKITKVSSSFPADTTKSQLIDGALELVDLLYHYITTDGVGLAYVQRTIQNNKDKFELLEECKHYMEQSSNTQETTEALIAKIDFAMKKTLQDIVILENREHDNTIMLNDLISFIMQLKSILTYLKEEEE